MPPPPPVRAPYLVPHPTTSFNLQAAFITAEDAVPWPPCRCSGAPSTGGSCYPQHPGGEASVTSPEHRATPRDGPRQSPLRAPSGAGIPACHPLRDTRLHQSHQPGQSASFWEPQARSWPSMTVAPSLSASQPGSGRACPPASPRTWVMHCPGPGRQPPWLDPQPAGRWDTGEPDTGVSVLRAGSQHRALVFQRRFPK